MSTLSANQASGKAIEARLCSQEITVRIDEILRNFDVPPSKTEQHVSRYAFLYLLGTFLLGTLFYLADGVLLGVSKSYFNMNFLSAGGIYTLLPVVGISLIIGVFNVWRKHVPHTLRDIFEKRRISVPTGKVNTVYLEFLERYRNALRSPRRYLLIGGLMVIMVIEIIFYPSTGGLLDTIRFVLTSSQQQKMTDTIFWSIQLFFVVFEYLGMMYCVGITLWALSISSWYMWNLSRAFEFRIEPVHSDHCGGLQLLGNFYFGLASPLFIGSVFGIGFLFVILRVSPEIYGLSVYAQIFAGLIIFPVLLCSLTLAILPFFVSIWNIHKKMLRRREKDEEDYTARIVALRRQIQALLNENQLEEAKTVKEKKELMEALHISSPT